MPNLEIPDMPDSLYKKIAELARSKGVPVEQEVKEILAKGLAADEAAEAELMAEIRRGREALGDIYLTEAEIQAGKRWGRE
jgi:plasmid stability protein